MSGPSLTRDTSLYGIHFLAPAGRMPGYLVKLERNRTPYQKWFGVLPYGSLQAALAAAQAWRDEVAPTLGGMTKKEFVTLVRPNNTSGIPGVFRTTRRKRKANGAEWTCDYWVARPPRTLKLPAKSFSVARYGEQQAKELAVEARLAYVEMCEGFHLVKTPVSLLPNS